MPDKAKQSSHIHQPRFLWTFLSPRYWPVWFMLLLLGLLMLLPHRYRWRLSCWLGGKMYQRNKKRRHIVTVNLELAFSAVSESARNEMAEAFFQYAAQVLLDYPLLFWSSPRTIARRVHINGKEHLDDALSQGKKVILLTGHMLGLEYGSICLTQTYPMVGLVKPARNALFEWWIAHGRTRFGAVLFTRDTGIRKVIQAIREGRLFYYLPDEDLGEQKQTEFLPFFATKAATLTSLGQMSRMCRAVVIPVVTRFDKATGVYTVDISEPLQDFPSGDDIQDALRMNQVLEQLILTAPEQYMWSFRLYQTRPEGEPSPYKNRDE